ncbi:hypothetical protein, conserved [Babesia bigemina]|uniref:Uncharacterized protein n=1 Tax=Babesia bigemina TaxID=5866 RepID=A0A061BPK3_BABBI|nr:hypothetical protein, conserved [Babesia bigemina]CDR71435.1 hypothetical protein, conserved [Babesia bigemina]|eukprot:XP_012770384.1 hypothetical protein, conserved [Babesia bigemina]
MLISLGHLAGQLGGFVGESESVKKAVVKAIIAKINSHEELKNDYSSLVTNLSESVKSGGQSDDTQKISELKSKVTQKIAEITDQIKLLEKPNNHLNNLPPSPSPSADSAKLRSKLEALEKVEKLCDFYTNFNNPQNDPKNLLVNLCDGLQTFLGFSSDSKGYTGSGIVYSDLDRLCDAVMGFLSGVLNAVKDDDAVRTYDKDISGDKIDTVISMLQSSIGSGRDGLVDAVAAVKEWLEGYGSQLNNKITAVKEPIEVMKNLVEHDKNEIKIEKDKNLITQVQEWTERAGRYASYADKAKKALKDIDPTLLGKLKCSISLLVQATGTFKAAAEDGDLKDVYEEAGQKMHELHVFLEKRFKTYTYNLHKYLKDQIGALNGDLTNFKNKQFSRLFSSINIELFNAFNTVQTAIERLETNYQSRIVDGLSPIVENAKLLKGKVESEKGILRTQVTSLGDRMSALTTLYRSVNSEVPDEVNKFKKSDGWSVEQYVEQFKVTIKDKISEYVTDELCDKITAALKKFTDPIANDEGDVEGSLDVIQKAVVTCAGKYKNFENIVKVWLKLYY